MSTKLVLLSTKALVGAAVVGQLLAFSSQANATAFAYSALEVSGFSMNNQFGGFTSFEFTSQQLSATLGANTIESPTVLTSTASSGSVDQLQLINGSMGIAANNSYFGANRPTLASPASNYAIADSHMLNTVILSGPGGNYGTQSGAHVSNGVTGSASTGTANSMSWTFNVSQAELDAAGGEITLGWGLTATRQVRVETTVAGETARATLSMRVNLLQDGDTIATVSHIQTTRALAAGQSPGAAGPVNPDENLAFGNAFVIDAVGDYTFNVEFDSSARATSVAVPEPAPFALLGLGMIALGALRRRKAA